jgi:preprotein translocase subunit SecF
MAYKIIKNKNVWFTISTILIVVSIVAFSVWGLKLGIDFTGGSLLEVKFSQTAPSVEQVEQSLKNLDLGGLTVQPTDQNGIILRFQNTAQDKHQAAVTKLKELISVQTDNNQVKIEGTDAAQVKVETQPVGVQSQVSQNQLEELRYESVGPSIGQELKRNAIYSIIIIIIGIVIYVAWAFRKVSRPVASWKYGLAGVIALFHDVIIVTGIFCILGKFYNIEVNTPFVAALLTVFGYSIADTIVVFDRIRENLPKSHDDFAGTVNYSVNQTMRRSINTSMTTMLTLLAIVLLGGESIRYFALALLIGIFFGTYSSIFLASPLLVMFEKWKK